MEIERKIEICVVWFEWENWENNGRIYVKKFQ
jgi:hypothetical protein